MTIMPPHSLVPLRAESINIEWVMEKLNAFERCYAAECWDDAFVNSHLIFVYWLYRKLWLAIRYDSRKVRHIFSLHSFDSGYPLGKFLVSEDPLEYSQLKIEERKLAKIFCELCDHDEEVRKGIKKLVDARNSILHPSGKILCRSHEDLELHTDQQAVVADAILSHIASPCLGLIESDYGKLKLVDLRDWGNRLNVEVNVVGKYGLSEVDVIRLLRELKDRLAERGKINKSRR